METGRPYPEHPDACRRAVSLIARVRDPLAVGRCRAVDAAVVPDPFRRLLAHNSHMTVAMERFHGAAVSLEIVRLADRSGEAGADPFSYCREILLRCPAVNPALFPAGPREPSGRAAVVQYGVVGIALERLPAAVADEIRRGETPLGRILIAAGLHREVREVRLLELQPGPHLAGLFGGGPENRVPTTYGRVATIDVAGTPVLRLLEVVGVPASTRRR